MKVRSRILNNSGPVPGQFQLCRLKGVWTYPPVRQINIKSGNFSVAAGLIL